MLSLYMIVLRMEVFQSIGSVRGLPIGAQGIAAR
jgi:hypothetical protein